MTEERCKELMAQAGMPNSRSLKGALEQVANETAQEAHKSPEAEAYWRGVIEEELKVKAEQCWNTFATESRGYAHSYFKQAAAFVRGKAREATK